MNMFNCFYPDLYYDSAYSIDYEKMHEEGVNGIIFDVDNTLVEHGAPITERAEALFVGLHKIGIDTCILSNNNEERVKPLADKAHSKYISKAGKPSPSNYLKAMALMGTDKGSTVMIGDQLFTDMWGANKAGIRSILVKPVDKHEEIQIIIKRRLEKIVMHFYLKKENRKMLTKE